MIPHISFTEMISTAWAIFIAGNVSGAYLFNKYLTWKKARKA